MAVTWVRSVVSLTEGDSKEASDGATVSVSGAGADWASEDFKGDIITALSPCDLRDATTSRLKLGFYYAESRLNAGLMSF